jgi:hypothetical protein
LISFKEFCDRWVDFCIQLERKMLGKYAKGKIKGVEFEKFFFENVLSSFASKDQRFLHQMRIRGINYKFDFLLVNRDASDIFDIEQSQVLAAFEVKAHGFYSYKAIEHVKSILESVERANPQIRLFYITFRETNTYDRKVREVFGNLAQRYYRLSDSGDGIQLPPRRYFPNEWDKLIENLKLLQVRAKK